MLIMINTETVNYFNINESRLDFVQTGVHLAWEIHKHEENKLKPEDVDSRDIDKLKKNCEHIIKMGSGATQEQRARAELYLEDIKNYLNHADHLVHHYDAALNDEFLEAAQALFQKVKSKNSDNLKIVKQKCYLVLNPKNGSDDAQRQKAKEILREVSLFENKGKLAIAQKHYEDAIKANDKDLLLIVKHICTTVLSCEYLNKDNRILAESLLKKVQDKRSHHPPSNSIEDSIQQGAWESEGGVVPELNLHKKTTDYLGNSKILDISNEIKLQRIEKLAKEAKYDAIEDLCRQIIEDPISTQDEIFMAKDNLLAIKKAQSK